MFHGDLHAGNLFLAEDGRLAVLDWSLTACLYKTQREALMAMVLGGLTLDARIRHAVATLGSLGPSDPALTAAVERSLDRLVFQGRLPGFDWLLDLLDDVAFHTVAGFREDLVLFRKTWLSLFGVLSDLVEQPSPDIQLLSLGLKRYLTELPARLRARPDSLSFSTHVSNADILQVCASPWLTSVRYWMRRWDRQVPRLSPVPFMREHHLGALQ